MGVSSAFDLHASHERAPEHGPSSAALLASSGPKNIGAPHFVRGSLDLESYARSTRHDEALALDRAQPSKLARPAAYCEVSGAPAPIFLPIARTPIARNPFRLYVSKLDRTNAFTRPEAKDALERLLCVDEKPAVLDSRKPKVAILVSEPEKLIEAEGGIIARLVESVRANGCEPVLIPPLADLLLPIDPSERTRVLARDVEAFDAVIGPGGADVHPAIYGEAITHAVDPNFRRDGFEVEFLRAAIASDCFVLGICRSHQLIHAALGGKLAQDVIADGISSRSRNQNAFGIPKSEPLILRDATGKTIFEHRVRVEPGSDFSRVLGNPESVLTNSLHHQSVTVPGRGLEITGHFRDPITGVASIEASEGRNVLTTQFHPELMVDACMRDLVATASRRAHVFRLKKILAATNCDSIGHLVDTMQKEPTGRFLEADYAWAAAQVYAPDESQERESRLSGARAGSAHFGMASRNTTVASGSSRSAVPATRIPASEIA